MTISNRHPACMHINQSRILGWNHTLWALLFLTYLSGCSSNSDNQPDTELETLSIPLDRSVLREPLANVVLPRRTDQQKRISEDDAGSQKSTRDRVNFGSEGMLITQPANPDGAGRVSGVKLLVPATGDFEVDLNCAIRRLDQPSVPQGAHGLSMRFVFKESGPDLVVLGCMSSQNCERCLLKRTKQGDEKPEQTMTPVNFSSGIWKIKRQSGDLSLVIESDDGDVIATEAVEGVTGRLEVLEIWCSRLPKGNAHAEILLRDVTMRAAKLFPSEKQPWSYLPWIRWGLLALVIVLGGVTWWRK